MAHVHCSEAGCTCTMEQPATLCEIVHGDPARFGYSYLPENPEVETPLLHSVVSTGECPGCGLRGMPTRLVER